MTDLSRWVGRTRTETERLDARLARWMAAALDRVELLEADDGAELPAGWHWPYFAAIERQAKLGRDGHPQKGEFLPATEQPRRMWAGSRLRWHGAFRAGTSVEKRSEILSCELKQGRTGTMVLVTVGYRYRADGVLLLEEEHDIVYRDDATEAERRGDTVRTVTPDPVLLFRYSAATFNGHRIHYDRDYAREVEGYPGLVVHGPLIATLLLDLVQTEVAPGRPVLEFAFRARRPTFDVTPFAVHAGRPDEAGRVELWSTNNVGEVGLEGSARVG